MKRKVYTDGNGSSLIDVQGLGQYLPAREFKQQQQKIAELKRKLEGFESNKNCLNSIKAHIERTDVFKSKSIELHLDGCHGLANHIIEAFKVVHESYLEDNEQVNELESEIAELKTETNKLKKKVKRLSAKIKRYEESARGNR